MKLYMVRHTDYLNPDNLYAFHLPFYLSEHGREHAKKIGKWFVDTNLSGLTMYTSPIVRAVQTAELIASQTNSMVYVDKRLIESSCPYLEGKVKQDKDHWIAEEDDQSREKRDTLVHRMVSMYDEVVAKKEDCVFVSHGDPLTYLYYYLIKKEPPRYLWDPANEPKVIQRGEVLILDIEDKTIKHIKRKHL